MGSFRRIVIRVHDGTTPGDTPKALRICTIGAIREETAGPGVISEPCGYNAAVGACVHIYELTASGRITEPVLFILAPLGGITSMQLQPKPRNPPCAESFPTELRC
jgi:hypothetical protein